jgi:DDE superfamily endonuclease
LQQYPQLKTKREWSLFIRRISDEWYPKAKKITLVMDNFNTHSAGAFYESFEPIGAKGIWDRFEFMYTSKHGSWLNLAEIELHVLNGQCLNRHINSISKVKSEVAAWHKIEITKTRKIDWQFTT